MSRIVAETQRVRLVKPARRHLASVRVFNASETATALGWNNGPSSGFDWHASLIGHHVLRGFGPLMAETMDGKTIGYFGPWYPDGQPEVEVIWTVTNPALEGTGLAFEAASVARDYTYGLGFHNIVSYISPQNTRSSALATRLGAVEDGTWDTPSGKTVTVYRHPVPEAIQ